MKYLLLLTLVSLLSCSGKNERIIIRNWKMIKKEKYIEVYSGRYAPINMDILPNESYHFINAREVIINTGLSDPLTGYWQIQDSLLMIDLTDESKKFRIENIREDTLILGIDAFRLTFVPEKSAR